MWADLERARRELKALFDSALAHLFVYTLTAKSSALGDQDSIESSDDAKAPGAPSSDPKPQRSVARINPFGFRSVPPKGLRQLTLRLGSSNLLTIGIAPTNAYGPSGMDMGETTIFCSANGTRVYLDKNGVVHIDAATGQDIILNGGNLQVARKTDKTIADTTMATFITTVCSKFNAPAAPMASAPGTLVPPTDFGVINGGADHVKG